MLTGLNVSSFACKCVFYRPDSNAKGGPHKVELWRSWNTEIKHTIVRAQKVDEKNGFICLLIMFTFRVMVLNMSKMAYFLCFLLTNHSVNNICERYSWKILTWKIFLSSSRKLCRSWALDLTICEIVCVKLWRKLQSQLRNTKILDF